MLLDFRTSHSYKERPAARLVLHALSSVSYLDQTDMELEVCMGILKECLR